MFKKKTSNDNDRIVDDFQSAFAVPVASSRVKEGARKNVKRTVSTKRNSHTKAPEVDEDLPVESGGSEANSDSDEKPSYTARSQAKPSKPKESKQSKKPPLETTNSLEKFKSLGMMDEQNVTSSDFGVLVEVLNQSNKPVTFTQAYGGGKAKVLQLIHWDEYTVQITLVPSNSKLKTTKATMRGFVDEQEVDASELKFRQVDASDNIKCYSAPWKCALPAAKSRKSAVELVLDLTLMDFGVTRIPIPVESPQFRTSPTGNYLKALKYEFTRSPWYGMAVLNMEFIEAKKGKTIMSRSTTGPSSPTSNGMRKSGNGAMHSMGPGFDTYGPDNSPRGTGHGKFMSLIKRNSMKSNPPDSAPQRTAQFGLLSSQLPVADPAKQKKESRLSSIVKPSRSFFASNSFNSDDADKQANDPYQSVKDGRYSGYNSDGYEFKRASSARSRPVSNSGSARKSFQSVSRRRASSHDDDSSDNGASSANFYNMQSYVPGTAVDPNKSTFKSKLSVFKKTPAKAPEFDSFEPAPVDGYDSHSIEGYGQKTESGGFMSKLFGKSKAPKGPPPSMFENGYHDAAFQIAPAPDKKSKKPSSKPLGGAAFAVYGNGF